SNTTLFSILPGMRDLSARINSTIELALYTNSKKRGLRDVGGSTQARFSDIAFWLGSLFFIFSGFDLFRSRGYLKFLSGNASYPWVFFSAIVTRAVLSVLGIIVIFGCNIAWVLLRGVRLTPADVAAMPGYLVVLSAMLLFFFVWGTFIGSISPNWKGISALIIIWFSFVYLIPKGLYSLAIADYDDKSSPYRLDSEKKH
ncbi:MAG: hypothetical protein GY950_11790, partial [bacterium]|nr:hypothetical protein [bacterium]